MRSNRVSDEPLVLTIHHVSGTRSVRLIWLCEELAVGYLAKNVDFSDEFRRSTEWRALSPSGKVPALTDGDLALFESGAMMQYVVQTYGKGQLQPPAGTDAWARHLAWMWFGEATLSRPMGANRILRGGDLANAVVEKVSDALDGVESAFAGRDRRGVTADEDGWLLGDVFHAADIMVGYTLITFEGNGLLQERPVLQAYVDRLKLRPACQAAFKA